MGLAIVTQGGRINNYVIDGYVDSIAELNAVQKDYAPGSKITVLDDGSVWILNSDKIWRQYVGGAEGGEGSGTTPAASKGIEFVTQVPDVATAKVGMIYAVKSGDTGKDDYEMWAKNSEGIMVQIDATTTQINNQITQQVAGGNSFAKPSDMDGWF